MRERTTGSYKWKQEDTCPCIRDTTRPSDEMGSSQPHPAMSGELVDESESAVGGTSTRLKYCVNHLVIRKTVWKAGKMW